MGRWLGGGLEWGVLRGVEIWEYWDGGRVVGKEGWEKRDIIDGGM